MKIPQDTAGFYNLDDLNHIFVTDTDKTGQRAKISLKNLSNSQFEIWAKMRFQHLVPDDVAEHYGKVWNFHQRLYLINKMCEVLGRPSCVVEK